MEKLEQLLAAIQAIDAKLDELLASDELTDEQKAEHDKLVSEREQKAIELVREKDRVKREQDRLAMEAGVQAAKTRQAEADREKAKADELAKRAITPQPGQLRLSNPDVAQAGDIPRRAPKVTIPATAKRCQVRNFSGHRNGMDAEHRAYAFGMWVLSQFSQQMPGRFKFKHAEDWVSKYLVGENDSSGYSNLVPEQFGTDLIVLREKRGIARQLFKNVPMSSDTRTDPRRTGGLTAYVVAESAAGTESNKTWDNVRLTAKDLMVITRYTNQLAMDEVIGIGDDIAGECAYALADFEDKAAFNGDGTSTYAGIVGARTKLTNFDGLGTVSSGLATGSGAAWSNLTLADFGSVLGKLPQYADTPNATWVCHKAFYHGVIQKLELAAGGNSILEIADADRRPRPLFMGYPVTFSQVFPSASAGATVFCLLGDFNLGASFGDRQMDQISISEHASIGGQSLWERNQVGVRCTERMDINVHDVGDASNPGPIVGLKTA